MNVWAILCAVLSLVHGQTLPCLPNGHDLNVILDKAFTRLDVNKDGLIQVTEFQAIIGNDDKNADGNVTLEEFKTAFGYHEIYEPMFHHFDHNADGVLETSDMVKELLVSDANGTESHLWKQPLSWSSRWEVIIRTSGGSKYRVNCISRPIRTQPTSFPIMIAC